MQSPSARDAARLFVPSRCATELRHLCRRIDGFLEKHWPSITRDRRVSNAAQVAPFLTVAKTVARERNHAGRV